LGVLKSLPLNELSLSPELIRPDDLEMLKELKLIILRGPSDHEKQTPEEFFSKYKNK
jgi:hypothetical protein